MKPLLMISAFLLVLTSCTYVSTPNTDTMMKKEVPALDTNMLPAGSMERMTPSDTMMKQDNTVMMKKGTSETDTKMELQWYQKYSPELVRSALISEKKVTLFFAASWCSTCKALNTEIMSHLASIPPDTLIVLVDYDDSTELKKQYGVTTQHTTIMLNADGTLKSKKLGAKNLAEILTQ